ncbi:hypothetical protein OSTOST_05469 [Ostertagia ostertagi]
MCTEDSFTRAGFGASTSFGSKGFGSNSGFGAGGFGSGGFGGEGSSSGFASGGFGDAGSRAENPENKDSNEKQELGSATFGGEARAVDDRADEQKNSDDDGSW